MDRSQILSILRLRNHHVEELEGALPVEDMSMGRRLSPEQEALLHQEAAPGISGA